jgi:hypothetical protein
MKPESAAAAIDAAIDTAPLLHLPRRAWTMPQCERTRRRRRQRELLPSLHAAAAAAAAGTRARPRPKSTQIEMNRRATRARVARGGCARCGSANGFSCPRARRG